MCGITGIVHLNGSRVPATHVDGMNLSLQHRGPDGDGVWVDGNVGFGHRRLSIIDLSANGRQPMLSRDGRYVLTYNGELYNYRELKAELVAVGERFVSESDTEVVLVALQRWGIEAVNRFNGMFAFALLDTISRKLYIARDRYGIKPLYYVQQGSRFAFASEHKAFFTLPWFRRKLNKAALLEYFTFQNLFTDATLLEDVRTLPAGCHASLNVDDQSGPLSVREYWDYEFSEPEGEICEIEYAEELERLFCNAVDRQLVSDVEIGSYLSGGMDSGSITAVAAQSIPCLKTFTCGFDLSSASGMELAFDERRVAEHMSYCFQTEHYEMVLKSGDMERALPPLSWHLEEPRVGQSYPNYYAAKLASAFVKVVLSGTGGDELFGGYPWRYYRNVLATDFDDFVDGYYRYWQRLADQETLKGMFKPIWNDVGHVSTRNIFEGVFHHHMPSLNRPEDFINHSLYFEAKTFMHGLLLVEDKLSMAHGLEARVPFLDNDLVDFAMKCPVALKVRNLGNVVRQNENEPGDKLESYFKKTNDGKQLLRKVMANLIPESVVQAEKQGFSAPDASWFKGDSIEFVKRTLFDEDAKIYGLLDRDKVQFTVNRHLQGKENKRLLIWSLLNLETWLGQVEPA